MHTWFETTIKFEKIGEDGKNLKVSEIYLVDALSFTEAEARITEEMTPFITGEFVVSKVRRCRIAELFYNDNGSYWFRSKVVFVTLDEEKGIEKRTATTMLVQAEDITDALQGIKDGMKGTMSDYEIYAVTMTEIMEVFQFVAKEEE